MESITGISTIIERVSGISASISQSVKEQKDVIATISSNVTNAADSVSSVSNHIEGVQSEVATTDLIGQELVNAAELLRPQQGALREDVETFLKRIDREHFKLGWIRDCVDFANMIPFWKEGSLKCQKLIPLSYAAGLSVLRVGASLIPVVTGLWK